MITPADEVGNISMHPNKQKWPNSPMEAVSQSSDKPNGYRDQTDALSARTGSQSVESDAKMAENQAKSIRTPRNALKTPSSPSEATRQTLHELNAIGDHTDTPTVHTDAHSIETATETATDETKDIRMR